MYTYEYNKEIKLQELDSYMMVMNEHLSSVEQTQLKEYMTKWNFYEGYHWEDIEQIDKPQVTKNYCRSFVNKFVAFEFGKEVTFRVPYEDDDMEETPSPILDFINEVWTDHNDKQTILTELGQTKSVTGIGWIQVKYQSPGEFNDPFGEYPNGKIRLVNMSPLYTFPEYDQHDKDKLVKMTVMYPIDTEKVTLIPKRTKLKTQVYKMTWTDTQYKVELGSNVLYEGANPYGIIPFVPFINYPLANKQVGAGDIDDIIPLNVELNLKDSDISEIIDYHASPITVVYGADIDTLEHGANKMWGGLPKDAKVENLTMNTDLAASNSYVADIKKSIHEVGSVPENALGDIGAISNTSGVALQIMNMPLVERTNVKRTYSGIALQKVNKLIIFMGIFHKLIERPADGRTTKQLYRTEVVWKDPLPKDTLIELQQLQTEMQLGLESRQGAFNRLGKDGKKTMKNIDEDAKSNPEYYGKQNMNQLNSGMMNGETNSEMKNKEMTGKNKAPKSS